MTGGGHQRQQWLAGGFWGDGGSQELFVDKRHHQRHEGQQSVALAVAASEVLELERRWGAFDDLDATFVERGERVVFEYAMSLDNRVEERQDGVEVSGRLADQHAHEKSAHGDLRRQKVEVQVRVELDQLADVDRHGLDVGHRRGGQRLAGHEKLNVEVDKGVERGEANQPAQRLEHMVLHLQKQLLVVAVAAHFAQVKERRHPCLGLVVLAADPKTGQSQKLVVLLLHDSRGAVPVYQVHRERERQLGKAELVDHVHEEV